MSSILCSDNSFLAMNSAVLVFDKFIQSQEVISDVHTVRSLVIMHMCDVLIHCDQSKSQTELP